MHRGESYHETGEITDFLERMYGHHCMLQTISNMTKTMEKQVEAFKARTLAKRYDAIFIAIKRDSLFSHWYSRERDERSAGVHDRSNRIGFGLERGSRRSSASRR